MSRYDPPLPFGATPIDLVVASSVFTHLDPPAQEAWLAELRRVLAPGGMALVSIQGPSAREWFQRFGKSSNSPDFSRRLRRMPDCQGDGVLFEPYVRGRWNRPEFCGIGETYGLTFNGHEQVHRTWSHMLNVEAIVPHGINGFQDIVVLRRPTVAG